MDKTILKKKKGQKKYANFKFLLHIHSNMARNKNS